MPLHKKYFSGKKNGLKRKTAAGRLKVLPRFPYKERIEV